MSGSNGFGFQLVTVLPCGCSRKNDSVRSNRIATVAWPMPS